MTELAGQVWGMTEARKAVLSIGAAKRWRRWFVENRCSGYAARFKWYTAIREVAGVAVLMSDVEEAWDLLPDEVQGVLEEYFITSEVGVHSKHGPWASATTGISYQAPRLWVTPAAAEP